jgi:hypothetical protein
MPQNPNVRRVIEENSPLAWTKRFGRAAPDVLWLATESPDILKRAVTSLERGEFALAVEPKGLEPLVHRVENAANRIVLGGDPCRTRDRGGFLGVGLPARSTRRPPCRRPWCGLGRRRSFALAGDAQAAELTTRLARTISTSGRQGWPPARPVHNEV